MTSAQSNPMINPDALLNQIRQGGRARQRELLRDVIFDAEYIEGENDDGEFEEKVRILKKIYIKYLE